MSRSLGAVLAAAAVVLMVLVVAWGWTCGARQVTAPCATPEECAAASVCARNVHPFAVAFALAALVALGLVLGSQGAWAMGIGVLVGGLGALSAFSLGFFGVAAGVLLVGAGWVATGNHAVGGAALAATLAPVAFIFGFIVLVPGPALWMVWVAALLPALLWLAYALARLRARPAAPA